MTENDSRRGEVRLIALAGPLDATAAARLWSDAWSAIDPGPAGLVVDLSGASGADSSVVNALVAADKGCRARGGALALVDGDSSMRALLAKLGLDARLSLCSTRARAVQAVSVALATSAGGRSQAISAR